MSEGSTLGDLRYALQIVMGWSDSHLHEFRIGHEKYGVILPDDYDQEPVNDENAFEVRDVLERKGKKFQSIYDFGDYWMHEVVVEEVTAPQPGMRYPVCIGGERTCPLEDCGGIYGYYDVLAILEDPTHDEYESYREWLPDNFDPNAFDMVQTNKELDEIEEWRRIAESEDEFDDSGGAPVAHNYQEPVSRLLALGLPRDHFDYATLGIGGEHVPALILMATDRGLHCAETGSAAVWAPVHAWRALGQLRAETAIEPLVGLLRLTDEEQDEWAAEDLPEVFSEIGAAAIPAIEAFLRDGSQGLWSRAAAGASLGKIGQRHPEARDTCVTALTDQVERRGGSMATACMVTSISTSATSGRISLAVMRLLMKRFYHNPQQPAKEGLFLLPESKSLLWPFLGILSVVKNRMHDYFIFIDGIKDREWESPYDTTSEIPIVNPICFWILDN